MRLSIESILLLSLLACFCINLARGAPSPHVDGDLGDSEFGSSTAAASASDYEADGESRSLSSAGATGQDAEDGHSQGGSRGKN